MTVQVGTLNEDRKQTRWQSIERWLTAINDAMNYDPQEYADTVVRQLVRKTEQLESRMHEIESKQGN